MPPPSSRLGTFRRKRRSRSSRRWWCGTSARSAGGIGRIGGIVFPALGGLALAAALPLETIMLVTAVPALVVAALIFALGIVNGGVIGGRMQRAQPA